MKKYLLAVLLLATFQSFGQFLNYTNINGRYKWIAGKFDSTFTLPSGTTPSLRTGGGNAPGALFYSTPDSSVYQYTGTQWIKLRGTSGVTSVGLSMPSAFSVTGSPITSSGTLAVTGAGTVSQYVRGDGSLSDFPSVSGGGGGKVYFFNGGVSKGTFGGVSMYQLGDTAVTGSAADFTRSTTGNIANFITDTLKPYLTTIPAGTWTIDAYLGETGGGSNHAELYAILEKWNGSTLSVIATSPVVQIVEGAFPTYYAFNISVPTTTIAVTDRIVIQFYIQNTNGKTVTLYTQDGKIAEVHTTLTTGIGTLNGLTTPTQFFATGTSGTDFAISSSTATHTFNLPTASGSNRGALSSTDWTTFNGKVGGSGTTNYVSKFTASGTIGNSQIFDNGTNVGINNASPGNKFVVSAASQGNVAIEANQSTKSVYFIPNSSGGSYHYSVTAGDASIIGYNALPLNLAVHNAAAIRVGTNLKFWGGYTATEQMTLTAAGRLLLGTTTESTYLLDVNGSFRAGNITSTIALNTGAIILTLPTGGTSYYANGFTFVSSGSSTNRTWFAYDGSNNMIVRQYAGSFVYSFDNSSDHFRIQGASVSIGSSSPNASAQLDVNSTTKGFLPPRMTGTQAEAISSPAVGLMVYSTDGSGTTITSSGWWGYSSSGWVKLN